jgi:hypothetical protein
MKTRAFLAAALAVVSTTFSAAAQQPWIKDRATGEGIGIRTGNLELHPGVAGEIGYDSNYFQRADDEEPIIDVYRLRVTPHLTLKTLGPARRGPGEAAGPQPTVNFTAGVYVAYNYLIAADSDNQDAVDENNHVVNAGASFTLDVLPGRPVGFDMYGDFLRTAEPSNLIANDTAFDRDSLRLGLGVSWRPGGGLFEWRLGYELGYHFFENDTWESLNNAQHTVMTRGRFRFLPRTALIYDGRVTFLRYSDTTSQNNGEIINSKIGVNGLITHHFGLLALAGWAASFYEGSLPQRNYDGPTAHAELKWFILPQPTLQPGDATVGLSTVAIGYVRDYANSYLGDYYRRDRGYLNFSYFIGGVAVIALEGGYSHYAHSDSFYTTGTLRQGAFGENRVDATAFGEYRLTESVGINATLRYTSSLDDNRVRVNELDPTQVDNLQFSRYEAYLGVRWFM